MQSRTTSGQKPSLYDQDFYRWIQHTVQALKNRALDQVDWENLIEEIDSMGRSEKKELKSRLLVILEHLLKLMFWESEKAQNSRGWRNTVIEQRGQLELLLDDSPSLRPMVQEFFLDSYARARTQVLQKSDLPSDRVPALPPFSVDDALNTDFLPR
ncbi:DUF29 domain-containing protein [Nodosilinea sp. LEGE 07298]|uniref:DUF29 domain-containing protein n=1 Tax=Nodosilinea sp. LEGE 07298 TaxID=2777970 RepID=UPI001880284B|nr:DUF29 domain-containing protein [Nodosilinea sp. LEGE 07298]MBE9110794.1 DUF29 domain-containing protein [Nodosilinea sp. LEGE 07298]